MAPCHLDQVTPGDGDGSLDGTLGVGEGLSLGTAEDVPPPELADGQGGSYGWQGCVPVRIQTVVPRWTTLPSGGMVIPVARQWLMVGYSLSGSISTWTFRHSVPPHWSMIPL
jgi:hypothetical protein